MATDKGTVILLPQTVNHYRQELTRLLEAERYAEAVALLEFLLGCRSDDPQTREEWEMLHAWMESRLDRLEGGPREAAEPEEPEEEAAMLRRHVTKRALEDGGYGDKLLALLTSSESIEKQLLALEQLAFLPDPALDEPIVRWLERTAVHPLVQFKGLQTLKKRGAPSPVHVVKEGRRVRIDLEDVPSGFDDFPRLIQGVAVRVRDVCEGNWPGLADFAEQLWKAFLAHVFGTAVYAELVGLEEEEAAVWAAGLHAVANEWMGGPEDEADVLLSYGLTDRDRRAWKRVCRRIRAVFQA
jgi:hypothetical protein